MSAHSPGPWHIANHPDKAAHWQIIAAQGPLNVCPAIVHSLTDARLIAVAPDMLAALKLFVCDWHDEEGLVQALDVARAAIAKAEGKS